MIDLNICGQEVETRNQEIDYSQPVSHHHSISIWPYKSVNSQMNSSATTPDLELKLAAPNPIDENKSSESCHLTGAISVI